METTSVVMSITDEQIAEIEAIANDACQYAGEDWFKAVDLSAWFADDDAQFMASSSPFVLLALISRLRAAERDAARIEWLASQCEMRYGHREHAQYSADFGIFFQSDRDQCRPCDFRAAIDAAMEGEQQ